MLRMLDRHAVQEMRRAGLTARAIAKQSGVSVRRIGREPPVTDGVEGTARQARRIGRCLVHFAAYRLKYSRWIHVVLVPNERVAGSPPVGNLAAHNQYRVKQGGHELPVRV